MPESLVIKLLECTSQIVTAQLSQNRISSDEIPALIRKVSQSLAQIGGSNGLDATERTDRSKLRQPANNSEPAVAVKKSITPNYIVCLEDGKKLKMLKRHLKTTYNMTPEQYRKKWNLSPDYPMVAPNYALQRSQLAKKIGLGTRGKESRRAARSA